MTGQVGRPLLEHPRARVDVFRDHQHQVTTVLKPATEPLDPVVARVNRQGVDEDAKVERFELLGEGNYPLLVGRGVGEEDVVLDPRVFLPFSARQRVRSRCEGLVVGTNRITAAQCDGERYRSEPWEGWQWMPSGAVGAS